MSEAKAIADKESQTALEQQIFRYTKFQFC